MNPQKKRRSRVVEVGKGPARVRIYTITRRDGYPQFTLNWKEGGRRRTRCLACWTMFGFAKRQGYLHPDRKTAAEQSETFVEPETEIQIFTPEEMRKMLLASHARLLPVLAIGAFAGIRSAEIQRLHWEDIKWERRQFGGGDM